jgi:hypothetical protein
LNEIAPHPQHRAAADAAGTVPKKLPAMARSEMPWMPASRHQPFWPAMTAFAVPSFYDGRVRINLAGREANGIVPREDYERVCSGIVALLRECKDAITGQPAVKDVSLSEGDPLALSGWESDIYVYWRSTPLGLVHPKHGKIGPVPFRRTGGHSGERGFLYAAGPGVRPGEYPLRSAFDVVPTIFALSGQAPPDELSGEAIELAAARPRLRLRSSVADLRNAVGRWMRKAG